MRHIKKKAGFCFVRFTGFFCNPFDPLRIQIILVMTSCILEVSCRNNSCKHKGNQYTKPDLCPRHPAVDRCDLKIPGVIRYGTGNFQRITAHMAAALCNRNFFAGCHIFFPNPIFKRSFFQSVHMNFLEKSFPVDHQNGKSPER